MHTVLFNFTMILPHTSSYMFRKSLAYSGSTQLYVVKQLVGTIVCYLMMGQWFSKDVAAGVL
jgi:hypothetical protein